MPSSRLDPWALRDVLEDDPVRFRKMHVEWGLRDADCFGRLVNLSTVSGAASLRGQSGLWVNCVGGLFALSTSRKLLAALSLFDVGGGNVPMLP